MNKWFNNEDLEMVILIKKLISTNKLTSTIACDIFINIKSHYLRLYLLLYESLADYIVIDELIEVIELLPSREQLQYYCLKPIINRLPSSFLASKFFADNYNLLDTLIELTKQNIPFSKLVCILETANIPEVTRQLYLKKLYPLEMNKYRDKNCTDIKKNIFDISKNKLTQLEENIVLNELKYELSYEVELDINEIFKKLFRTPNLEFNNDFYEIIFTNLVRNYLKRKSIQIEFINFNLEDFGRADKDTVFINKLHLNKKFSDNTKIIKTLFHEISHIKQFEEINSTDNYNYLNLKFVKDYILYLEKILDNDDNYRYDSMECDARCFTIAYYYRFLNKFLPLEATKFLKENIKEYRDNYLKRNHFMGRIILGEEINLDDIFNSLSSDKIKKYLKSYPILKTEYTEIGEKKSITEIVLEYINIYNKLDSLSKNNDCYNKTREKFDLYSYILDNHLLYSFLLYEIDNPKKFDLSLLDNEVKELSRITRPDELFLEIQEEFILRYQQLTESYQLNVNKKYTLK